jgi:hypothetical protein
VRVRVRVRVGLGLACKQKAGPARLGQMACGGAAQIEPFNP